MNKYITVFCTVPDDATADKISESLVAEKLVACVNIVPGLKSVYTWENKVCNSNELLLIMKTRAELFLKLKERILKLHPYQVPEVISVEISEGHIPYLAWIDDNIIKEW